MSTTPEARIRKAFNRLVASADGKPARELLLRGGKLAKSESEADRELAADCHRKAMGKLITLAKRQGEFALATYLRTTPQSFEIR